MKYNFFAGLTIIALIFTIALWLIFLSKKKEKSLENNTFVFIIITTFISIIIEIYVQNFMAIIPLPMIVNDIINKLAFINNELYCFGLFIYSLLRTSIIDLDISDKIKKIKHYSLILGLLIMISLIFIVFLPIEYHYNMEGTAVLYVSGLSVNIAFAVTGFFLTLCGYVLFKSFFKEKEKRDLKKIFWNIVTVTIGLFLLVCQGIDNTFTACQFVQMYVLVLIYFNIENPDIKLIEEVNNAKSKAEEINTNKNNFLSNMSHEVRTPLNAILGLSKNLLSSQELPTSIKEDINDIILASNNLLEIVGNIIDINKTETEVNEIKEVSYNFKSELQSLIKVLATKINNKPIALGVIVDPNIPDELVGDKYCIKTILNNLLSNAIRFTEKGQITVTMKVVNFEDDKCNLQIQVSDTGVGMKQDQIANLFNQFEKLDFKTNLNVEGSGLGLSIVNKILNLMGGKISVKSTYGVGSTFDVFFSQKVSKKYTESKINSVLEMQNNASKPITNKIVLAEEYKGMKVLIVDDNKINIKVARRNIDGLGFEIDDCDNGKTCIDKIKDGNHYDVILMDIMMPVMDGVEALKELRKIEGFNTPVIALTADAIAGSQEKYIEEGFNSYVSKPFTKEEIKKAIDEVLKSV